MSKSLKLAVLVFALLVLIRNPAHAAWHTMYSYSAWPQSADGLTDFIGSTPTRYICRAYYEGGVHPGWTCPVTATVLLAGADWSRIALPTISGWMTGSPRPTAMFLPMRSPSAMSRRPCLNPDFPCRCHATSARHTILKTVLPQGK
jgi:hypothetical protein